MRNLKTLGTALVAMFAMSVVVASAAHAANFTATKAPAIITGHQEGTENYFEVPDPGGLKVECPAPTFDGTQATTSSSFLTITPTYEAGGKCTTSLGTNATIDMNGCDYKFTVGTQISTHAWNGSVHVECPAGQEIRVTTGPCTVDVKAQTIEKGITYTNITNANKELEDVTVDIDSTLKATVTNVFLCPFSGEQNARYVSKVTVKGFIDEESGKKEGAQTGVLVD